MQSVAFRWVTCCVRELLVKRCVVYTLSAVMMMSPVWTVHSLALDRLLLTSRSETPSQSGPPKITNWTFHLIWNHTFYLFLYRGFQNHPNDADVSEKKIMTRLAGRPDVAQRKTQIYGGQDSPNSTAVWDQFKEVRTSDVLHSEPEVDSQEVLGLFLSKISPNWTKLLNFLHSCLSPDLGESGEYRI